VIHWKRRKKIQAALEAENNNPRKKIVLNDKIIDALQVYVKRYFVEVPKKTVNLPASAMASIGTKSKAYFSSSRELDEYIKKEKNKIFTRYLMERLAERDLSTKGLYKLTGLNRSIKQKIEVSSDLAPYQPDKDTVIKMGMGMQMDFDEMSKMLAAAGFALSKNDKKDIVIKYCIDKKIYDRDEVDALIYEITGKSLYRERKSRKTKAL